MRTDLCDPAAVENPPEPPPLAPPLRDFIQSGGFSQQNTTGKKKKKKRAFSSLARRVTHQASTSLDETRADPPCLAVVTLISGAALLSRQRRDKQEEGTRRLRRSLGGESLLSVCLSPFTINLATGESLLWLQLSVLVFVSSYPHHPLHHLHTHTHTGCSQLSTAEDVKVKTRVFAQQGFLGL